jgi:hypothetical protein
MLRSSAFIIALFALVASVQTTHAQDTGSGSVSSSGSIITGSGAVEPTGPSEEDIRRDKEQKRRAYVFDDLVFKGRKGQETWNEAVTAYHQKRPPLRVQCREDIRRSNKEQLLATKLRCYRGELTLDREYYVAMQKYVQGIPGQTPIFKASVVDPVSAALEAVNSFINAIDQEVFENEEQLMEAKENLAVNYRLPAAEAMTLVRADRLLSWIYHLQEQVDAVALEQDTLAKKHIETWDTAKQCLQQAQDRVYQVFMPEETQKKQTYRTALSEFNACLDSIKAIQEIVQE